MCTYSLSTYRFYGVSLPMNACHRTCMFQHYLFSVEQLCVMFHLSLGISPRKRHTKIHMAACSSCAMCGGYGDMQKENHIIHYQGFSSYIFRIKNRFFFDLLLFAQRDNDTYVYMNSIRRSTSMQFRCVCVCRIEKVI